LVRFVSGAPFAARGATVAPAMTVNLRGAAYWLTAVCRF
jgi:hypothetical protein